MDVRWLTIAVDSGAREGGPMHARVPESVAIKRCQESRQDRLSQVLEALDAGDEDRFVFRLHRTVPKGTTGCQRGAAEGHADRGPQTIAC